MVKDYMVHVNIRYVIIHQGKLLDLIKQIRTLEIMFFTFSAADMYWPELHNLMPNGKNQKQFKMLLDSNIKIL
jgi:hypothetical protein